MAVIDLLAEYRPPRGGKIDLMEVENEIHALAHRFNVAFTFDPWQGGLMMDRLGARGGGVGGRLSPRRRGMPWSPRFPGPCGRPRRSMDTARSRRWAWAPAPV